MGPISPLLTTSAKVFASLYALREWFDFCQALWGLFSLPWCIVCAHQFQVNLKKENYKEGSRQQQ